ncbi:hypothetical protein ACQEVM_10195 [Streptomyces sp. CA-243310]|uniref:hypothetical protein n=1 Tax=Streptomyces sp. CA-243310 TaxID=3240056 RepID=UPI003D8B7C6C
MGTCPCAASGSVRVLWSAPGTRAPRGNPAEALSPYVERLVIATRGGMVRTGPDLRHVSGRPERLREPCGVSPRGLGPERIDLYRSHRREARSAGRPQAEDKGGGALTPERAAAVTAVADGHGAGPGRIAPAGRAAGPLRLSPG